MSCSARWIGGVAILAACAPAAPDVAPPPTAPLPGDNYAYLYEATGTVGRYDTRTGRDSTIADAVDEILASAASPDGRGVAVAVRVGDSTRAVAVEVASGAVTELHRGVAGTTYTLGWDAEGTRLGVGYRPADGGGGVLVRDADGRVRDMGCRASNRFVAWRSAAQAVVYDGANYYTVSAADCATVSTFSRVGKRSVTFAPNGRRVAYGQDRTVPSAAGGNVTIPELYVAGADGSDGRIIADFRSRPSHYVWSPGAGALAYEVASARWANTTHVVIYHVGSNEYTYEASEQALGVPSDYGVCWAPDGRFIAHLRTYARRGAAGEYTTYQVVVRGGGSERVVVDELDNLPASAVMSDRSRGCQWVGPAYLLVGTRRGYRVVRAADGEAFGIPADREVLGVTVFPR